MIFLSDFYNIFMRLSKMLEHVENCYVFVEMMPCKGKQ